MAGIKQIKKTSEDSFLFQKKIKNKENECFEINLVCFLDLKYLNQKTNRYCFHSIRGTEGYSIVKGRHR